MPEMLAARQDVKARICDFCSEPDPPWCYPAEGFNYKIDSERMGMSVGDWLACDSCRAFIEMSAWSALAERSVYSLLRRQGREATGFLVRQAVEQVGGLHRLFRSHRLGGAVRCGGVA